MSRFAGLPCRMSSDQDRASRSLRPTANRLLRIATAGTLSLALPFALSTSSTSPAARIAPDAAPAAAFATAGLLGAIGEISTPDGSALSATPQPGLAGTLIFGDPADPATDPPPAPPPDPAAEPPQTPPSPQDEVQTGDPPPDTNEDDEAGDPPMEDAPEGAVVPETAEVPAPGGEVPSQTPGDAIPAPVPPVGEAAPAASGTTGETAPNVPSASGETAPAAPGTASVPAPNVPAETAPVAAVEAPADAGAQIAARNQRAAGLARTLVGRPYRYGATGPRAFDCSGLTLYVYRQFGVELPHKARAQFSERYGKRITSMADLQPGDLVFFRNTAGRGISHAAIYVGGGMMVTANTPRQGVRLASMAESYWRRHWAGGIRPGL